MVQNVALTTFTSSAVVVYLMQRLKRAKWFPLVQEDRAKLNRLFSIGAAAIGAMSVEYVWNPSTRNLGIHIPTLWVAIVGLWHWLNHYAMQETIYQATANSQSPLFTGALPPAAAGVQTSAERPVLTAAPFPATPPVPPGPAPGK
jgi:hypothetical protein